MAVLMRFARGGLDVCGVSCVNVLCGKAKWDDSGRGKTPHFAVPKGGKLPCCDYLFDVSLLMCVPEGLCMCIVDDRFDASWHLTRLKPNP